MKNIFRLDASIRREGSVTRAVADTLQASIEGRLGESRVKRRDVGLFPLPATAWAASALAGFVPEDQRSLEQKEAQKLAAELADELVDAQAFIFAIPLYNFGVSQHAKTWVDILLTDPRFAPGAPRLLAGRPAFLVVARGGGYGAGTPRHGWDHATGWLLRILRDVMELNVELIEAELTLADVTPAMASLRELAAQNLQDAHGAAARHGEKLASLLAPGIAAE
ncbi:FMN-dependent NADH-azoreductase [Devosia submarina]|uniref:FMN-dependent NADH-azoreductase n=1 Tax=Devosia submarina TaxID=1173082 RepID=UPI000D35AA2C|nr:NAD(P)H-dependent oxidoreductase [Devosia submarina]